MSTCVPHKIRFNYFCLCGNVAGCLPNFNILCNLRGETRLRRNRKYSSFALLFELNWFRDKSVNDNWERARDNVAQWRRDIRRNPFHIHYYWYFFFYLFRFPDNFLAIEVNKTSIQINCGSENSSEIKILRNFCEIQSKSPIRTTPRNGPDINNSICSDIFHSSFRGHSNQWKRKCNCDLRFEVLEWRKDCRMRNCQLLQFLFVIAISPTAC